MSTNHNKIAKSATPGGKPFLTADWKYLAMLNYEIEPLVLEPLVPRGTQLDSFRGKTYVSMVGFLFLNTRLKGLRIPLHRNFEEVNLRFYIRRRVEDGWRRGVVFVKEIVPRWTLAATARLCCNENYIALPMSHNIDTSGGHLMPGACVRYAWRFKGQWNSLEIRTQPPSRSLVDNSEEEFITEHFWGYARQKDGGTVEYEVRHPRWNVWSAEAAELDCEVSALYGTGFEPFLRESPSSAYVVRGSEVSVLPPVRIN